MRSASPSPFRSLGLALTVAALLPVSAAAPVPGGSVAPAASAAFADGVPAPGDVLASLDDTRPLDDLTGAVTDTTKQVRLGLFGAEGTTFDVTVTPVAAEGLPAATGLSLALCTAAGTDLLIAGSSNDVSADGIVRWKKVALPGGVRSFLVLRATGAGGYRVQLKAKPATASASGTFADVAAGAENEITVVGYARGTLQYKVAPDGRSNFLGEVVRVLDPDGDEVPGLAQNTAKGTLVLEKDGAHRVVFRNAASRTGDAAASAKAAPPKAFRRVGFLRPSGVALVPFVKKIDPVSAFHRDDALAFSVTGRDFQDGLDLRLERSGREDILGTDVVVASETTVTCTLDLDTTQTVDGPSTGTWTVALYNAPVYAVAEDRSTLVRDTATKDRSKTFTALASSSIRLPAGVVKNSEVWFLDFNDDFATDLDRMGLSSGDPDVRASVREAVEAYVVCYLRDLFRADETTGKVSKTKSIPVSFVVERPSSVAGDAGTDYNRIEIGGARQTGDDRDTDEPLLWGFAPIDTGNAVRNDLSVTDGNAMRVGHGVRTRVLDPGGASVASSFVTAMAPLRNAPLTATDLRYFAPGFAPRNQTEADRYRDIVRQVERASREIAAITGHHIGRAMGLPTDGTGPMAAPSLAGEMWPEVDTLRFEEGDFVTLQGDAVPHALPGVTRPLTIGFFPLNTSQQFLLPNLTTDTDYTATFKFVGGRPNADADAYRVTYAAGSEVPRNLTLTFGGLSGRAPTMLTATQFYCDVSYLRIAVEDRKRGTTRLFAYRLNVLPNIPLVPSALQPQATTCRDQVLATP